ncbi:LuxR C-terminal-related transcriptional regulator [Echinicola jeungdonensis]|uniref:LuxR C-terminal-related transcriptional regulator n=1 Tax=Echinicola jeungdonensis TaxID=709343 RepID=A0ABV5J7F3_9BACT|nr:LuxR C-terminal-related transcriptional regulator [Echinicola jeungdonensis]MDN3669075.1 LuxR C-terminal-related transcriptional regulator [Echinicola jeungdonensis]
MENSIEKLLNQWKEGYVDRVDNYKPYQAIDQLKHIAALFTPGSFFYFIMNMHNFELDYVHPNVEEFLGVKPEEASIQKLLGSILPEEMEMVKKKEMVLQDFFENFVKPEDLPFYKIMYFYKIKNKKGQIRTMLLQINALSVSEKGKIEHVLSVHTDITHLGLTKNDKLSFLSLNGKQSYYNIDPEPGIFDPDNAETQDDTLTKLLTKREAQIVSMLANGQSPNEMAKILNLSLHTIQTHRRNILRKTGINTTTELVAKCLLEGLI